METPLIPTSRTITGRFVMAGLLVLMAGPAMAQFRIEFQPQRRQIVVAPKVRTYNFGARQHVDDLAVQLERQANAICLEMHRNYRHNRGYSETYREMYQVLQDAKHIHELVHDQYHRSKHQAEDHIASDLAAMDDLMHHIEDDVARWAPARSHHAHGHHDHIHGGRASSQPQTLQRLVHEFTDSLHHLMTDYGVKSEFPATGEAPPPDNDIAPPPQGGLPPRSGRR